MSAGGKQQSLRKALGAIKDSTSVGLAKVNSGYKELDIAIVRATNHVERPAKEKHVQAIFSAISATRPRADVAYCIRALARRLTKTHNWAVALKTLIIMHRALREVDCTFREELINYGKSSSYMFNLAHFKDDSSASAWDFSAWVRSYALFLEERLECFRVLKYDIETEHPDHGILSNSACVYKPQQNGIEGKNQHSFEVTSPLLTTIKRTRDLDTSELLEQLPALQQLLFRLLACEPQGAAVYNSVIQLALSMVAGESVKIYTAICDGTINMVDKFFEMRRHDAVKGLDIYRRAGKQAERLSEFYDLCKSLGLGRAERFPKIEQSPASFLTAMEEYVMDAPLAVVRKDQERSVPPKVVLALEYKNVPEVQEAPPASPPPPEPIKEELPAPESPDLLGLNDPSPVASDLDEKNSMALAIVPVTNLSTDGASSGPDLEGGTTGWELALVAAPSSNETTSASKLAGGLDKLTLDSLYDDALRRANQNVSYNPWQMGPMANPMMPQVATDPFYASNAFSAPHNVQMAAMAQQQQAFMLQQQQAFMLQQQMMMAQQPRQTMNPFGSPYGVAAHHYGPGMPSHFQSYNSFTGFT